MTEQGLAYCAAMNAAMDDLDRICEESERLKTRLYQLDAAVEALKPMMALGERTVVEVRRPIAESIETTAEPVHAQAVPQNLTEPTDPIRRRINSVLGLAVA